MSVLIFFVILFVLVLSHEFGHFIVAKKSGVAVDEFGFGFPPRIWGKQVGETFYSINWLPFGGFVKIQGEDTTFRNEHKLKQAGILIAGVVFNLILAWGLISIGLMSGMPATAGAPGVEGTRLVVTEVMPGSPAAAAGIKPGLTISNISYQNEVVTNPTPEQVQEFTKAHAGKEIILNNEIKITPVPTIGIAMDMVGTLKLPAYRAVYEGVKMTAQLTGATAAALFGFFKSLIVGQASLSSITGPIGIVGLVGDASALGFSYLIMLTALISINLAIINLIPFPALDGGRLLFLIIEAIKGTPINPKIANALNMAGFGLLILLMIFITYHDLTKLF